MADVFLKRRFDGLLEPTTQEDSEKLKRFKAGDIFKANVTKPRNIKFHCKFFSMLNMVFNNQDTFTNPEDLRKWLLLKTGFVNWVTGPDGASYVIPKSVQFHKMDDLEFGELYKKTLNVVWCDLIPSATMEDRDTFEQEILSYE